MEVFGLLNLLKSALETPPQSPAPEVPKEKASKTLPTPEPKESAPPRNPYLDFAQAHDARARKIKKK